MDETPIAAPTPTEQATTSPAPAPVPAPTPVELLVDAWFVAWFHDVPMFPVEIFNRCTDAKEDLKARLAAQPKER